MLPFLSFPSETLTHPPTQERTGCGAVLVKGGHLNQQQGQQQGQEPQTEAVDVLYVGATGETHELRGPWIHTGNTHGTGGFRPCNRATPLRYLLPACADTQVADPRIASMHGRHVPVNIICIGWRLQD